VKKRVTAAARLVRAVLAEWAERVWQVAALAVLIVSLVLVLGTWALFAFASRWWGLLWIPVVPAVGVLGLVLLVSRALIRKSNAVETPEQRAAVNALIDKLALAADVAGTPKPLLALRLVFDLATRRTKWVQSLLVSAVGLKGDIAELAGLFAPPGLPENQSAEASGD
jgi:hypothetical protein